MFLVLFLLLLCSFVVATTKLHINNYKNKNINLPTFSLQLSITQSFCCCCSFCCCYCVILLLQQQQKLHMKNKNKKINIHTFLSQLSITQSFCCCFCCYCVILLLQQQQNYTLKTTRTNRLIYIHFLFNN